MRPDQENAQVGFSEPRLVQIFHDSIEVVRILDGRVELNEIVSRRPNVLEIYWDKKLVYRLDLKNRMPTVNLMTPSMEKMSLSSQASWSSAFLSNAV